ncbi:MAG: PilX N-terminal domain-containing pilus assembly protein [Pseudolysinimonas sp.]
MTREISRQSRAQRGSAFILVLMALIVLTILGLALASITQSELNIGSNERTSSRTFYASEAGMGLLTARKVVLNDGTSKTYVLPDTVRTLGNQTTRDQAQLSMLLPILTAPCNLCEINNATSYTSPYQRSNAAYAIFATRVGVKTDKISTVIVAQRAVAGMLDVQPAQVPPEKQFANANEIKKLTETPQGTISWGGN